MPYYNRHFGAFVGGAELTSYVTHSEREEARDPKVPRDLTGYSINAEVWWEGCRKLSPSIEIANLATGNPHYILRLQEGQTASIPLGRVAWMKIMLEKDGVTEAYAPIWLERAA